MRQPPNQPQPNLARLLNQQERAALARLDSVADRRLADLSIAQRLDPGSLVLLSRLSSGALSSQALVQADDSASTTGKLLAGDYLAGTSPTLARLAPLLARADYSEADILYLLASYAARNGPLNDAAIEQALLASRSPLRRLWLWIKAHSSIWPD